MLEQKVIRKKFHLGVTNIDHNRQAGQAYRYLRNSIGLRDNYIYFGLFS
jgi:hypothetical protein